MTVVYTCTYIPQLHKLYRLHSTACNVTATLASFSFHRFIFLRISLTSIPSPFSVLCWFLDRISNARLWASWGISRNRSHCEQKRPPQRSHWSRYAAGTKTALDGEWKTLHSRMYSVPSTEGETWELCHTASSCAGVCRCISMLFLETRRPPDSY